MVTSYRFLLRALVLLTLAVSFTACGSDETKSTEPTAAEDAAADATTDAIGTDTTTVDSSVADTAVADTAVTDTAVTDTGATDTAQPAPTCGESLLCGLGCPSGDKACSDACAKGIDSADAAKLAAIASCHVDLCGAVTEGAVAELNCDFAKCYDKLDACMGFGAGELSCMDASVCIGGCVNGDAACKLDCMVQSNKASLATTKALRLCSDSCDTGLDDAARSACLVASCSTELDACTAGKAFTCREINVCTSHCEESLPIKPNTCFATCTAFGDVAARKTAGDLETCKALCVQAVNPVGCWGDKCGVELSGCYGAGGTVSCQGIDNCVSDKCDGVGGDATCIQDCVKTGKPGSQDAFVQYEGCVIKNMQTKEAKTAGCEFPYDQSTCLPVIKGQYCGNQSQNCFTDK
jgi:hypothetical protein